MGIKFIFVVDESGAEVDRVEYDDAPEAAAVTTVAAQLNIDLDAARRLVAKHNPGAEKTSYANAYQRAQDIVNGQVDGYPYPDAEVKWSVTEDQPLPQPMVSSVVQIPATKEAK